MFATIVLAEVAFLFVQVFVFYPCLTGAPEEKLGAFNFNTQERHRRASNSQPQPLDASNTNSKPANLAFEAQKAQSDQQKPSNTKKYEPNWESLESRPVPQWFEDAKVGIFLHWGVYSVPSYVGTGTQGLAEWFWYYWKTGQSQNQYHTNAAIKSVHTFLKDNYHPNIQYTDFAPQFTAEFFDPNHWADLFKAAGAK